MKKTLLTASLLAACGFVGAKLPPADEATKAKAAEAAAKTAWQAKLDAYQLCKAQDRVVAVYRGKASAKPAAVPASAVKTAAAMPNAAAAVAPATPAAAAPAASGTRVAVAAPAAATPAAIPAATMPTASAPQGTPAAALPPTPCSDPGPFAYTPAEQKPLEASGAHSPTGTATSPPSVNATSSQMAPASATKK